jgi:hypothetical protein
VLLRLLNIQPTALQGLPLSQALVASENFPGMENALAAIQDVIHGTGQPPAADTFRIVTTAGIKIINLRSTHLTEMGMFECQI